MPWPLRTAVAIMGSLPHRSPAAERVALRSPDRPPDRARGGRARRGLDAYDLIYRFDASRDYDPSPRLEAITAPLTWVNSADDFINPRNLDFPQRAVKRMRDARFRLIPEVPNTVSYP